MLWFVMRLIPFSWFKKPVPKPDNFDNQTPGAGSLTQRLRLWSGLVLMTFVCLHFLNHALGNISLEVMSEVHNWRRWFWHTTFGSILLYGALATHVMLVLWKFVTRKSLRLPLWEWIQIILGLLIPYFLFTHIIAMRGSEQVLGIHVDYKLAFGMIWPGAALAQNFLLLVTWVHGCIGIHFWLRLNSWYRDKLIWIASLAALIPALALTGWVNAARFNSANLAIMQTENPDSYNEYIGGIRAIFAGIVPLIDIGRITILGLGALVLAIVIVRQILQRFKRRVKINYGDGKVITSIPGQTILEISRQAGIPHMSVCGGRARCSTCRTLIVDGSENLHEQTDAEISLLKKLNAENSIRLACQARVKGDVSLRPLVQPHDQQVAARSGDSLGWGVEREIAILFLDIRGFSRISEKSLPYDVVFILNSFFGEVSSAVEANNGYVDKFMGDGMMALFGLSSSNVEASRDAVRAAVDCVQATSNVSRILTQHLSEPIKIGIGVHVGDAVIGRIGKTSDQNSPSRLTAIGDSVNISSRLEQATKEFGTSLVVSTKTAKLAGIKNFENFGTMTEISVRNISTPVEILAVDDLEGLKLALK